MVSNYLIQPHQHHPILIVYYEDLTHSAVKEIIRILNFLDIPYTMNDVQKMSGFDQFHRNHTDAFEHYTKEQKQLINNIISWVISSVTKYVHKDKDIHIAHLISYLQ